jgi:predicted dehydrogenase
MPGTKLNILKADKMAMNILVLGCGSIGKRHIKNLHSMNVGQLFAYDVDKHKQRTVQKEFPVETFSSLEEALDDGNVDAAFICTPPSLHVKQALKLLEHGIHCFIEKPLSNTLAGLDRLVKLADQTKKTVLIGYNSRFSHFLIRIKKLLDDGSIGKPLFLRASLGYYLPFWRPQENYRKGYGAKQSLGGGILLDASHEIDYVCCLLGEVNEVFAVCKKISNLDIDTEDFVEITMYHKNGAYSQIHLDYLQTNYRRNCEIIGEKGMLIWDINERVLNLYDMNDKEYHVLYEGLNANVNDMYVEEAKHFFRCIEGIEKPLVGVRDGKRIVELIIKIKDSSAKRQFVSV